MRFVTIILAAVLAGTAPGMAYDAASQAVIERFKPGKLVLSADLAILMLGAERWCYEQQGTDCGWSDIYLSADETGVSYELTNAWNDSVVISMVDRAAFRDERYLCELGLDWVPSLRAFSSADGTTIEGRDLAALRDEIAPLVEADQSADCFDYIYRGHDADAQTVTLLQRQYVDGTHAEDMDAMVTVHFAPGTARSLGWYW